jgi:HPt (histidine-containing phosphotransfer) domain-containing protein
MVPENTFKNIDLSYLKSLSDNNKEFEIEVIEMFILQIDKEIDQINLAIKENDFVKTASLVHKLKGSFKMFEAKGAQELQKIENICKSENVDVSQILVNLDFVKETLNLTLEELKKELNNLTSL